MDYQPRQAALRVRRLQALARQHALDGILLIPGVDGGFSVCSQAVGYLLEGRSNRDTLDVTRLSRQLDDAVLLVPPHGDVLIYAPDAELREQLTSLLSPHLPALRILSPTPSEAADPDRMEEAKLASFVHMLRGAKRLGIPCGLAHRSNSSSASPATTTATGAALPAGPAPVRLGSEALMALERWPLLQAYGLEGVGRSGFFTMNFEVYDVQPCLHSLYGALDGRSVGCLLGAGEALPALRQHWGEMLQALGGKPPGSRGALSERQAVTLPPRVVFGARTSDDAAQPDAAALSALADPAPAGSDATGSAWRGALHGVAEAADPRSSLRVARSLFLCRGAAERDVFADADEEAEEGYSFEEAVRGWAAVPGGDGGGANAVHDAVQLMRTYAALVEAARAAMEAFAAGSPPLAAKAVAQEVLARRAEQLGAVAAAGSGSALAGRLRFSLLQADHANRVTAPAVHGSRQLKEDDGGEDEASPAAGPAAVPAPCRVPPSEALGELLSLGGGDEALLLTGSAAVPALSGALYCFSAGLVFVEGVGRSPAWCLDLRRPGVLEALTVQHLRVAAAAPPPPGPLANGAPPAGRAGAAAGPASAPASAAADVVDLGEAVVFRGCGPAAGLAPARHLTTNTHVALALGAMSQVLRLSLPDIASAASGRVLGGLVYGDTFLDLPYAGGAAADGDAVQTPVARRLLVLTESIPVLSAVPAGCPEEELARRAARSLQRVVGGAAGGVVWVPAS
ncbi:hypothetical protein GPECTOR_116g343 [Gonium pectorale]|uniref:DAAF9 N-terminal domain-containing protein n=1 Tax=Gonium pectorale TaxID=33097 RepID=A0A150FYX7_GONPE|nr:hypothetical protein GPECTOR_116g343 [Gonium pectorale]|eukprot:KXZ42811.1 hypothetical protein GPECTOR_116g343 [Gonium pectorale]